jgi:hypothetical protein
MDYAVGDYSGMFSRVTMVIEKLRGNDKDVLADMSDVFDVLLKMKLATQDGRVLVKSELESVERMLTPETPTLAPVKGVVYLGAAPPVAPVEPIVAP